MVPLILGNLRLGSRVTLIGLEFVGLFSIAATVCVVFWCVEGIPISCRLSSTKRATCSWFRGISWADKIQSRKTLCGDLSLRVSGFRFLGWLIFEPWNALTSRRD